MGGSQKFHKIWQKSGCRLFQIGKSRKMDGKKALRCEVFFSGVLPAGCYSKLANRVKTAAAAQRRVFPLGEK